VHRLEDLERADERDDGHEEQGRRQQGQPDPDQQLPPVCPVYLGGLDQARRDHLQPSEQHDEREADRVPQVDADDGSERGVAVGEQLQVVQPEFAQVVRDEAEVRVERVHRDERDDRPGDEHREEERGAQSVAQPPRHRPADRKGQGEPHEHVQDDAGDSEDKGDNECVRREGIVQQVPVVVQADEHRRGEQVVAEQAQHHGAKQRQHDEGAEQQQRRRQEQEGRPGLLTLPPRSPLPDSRPGNT
jgi:hypothetical protein